MIKDRRVLLLVILSLWFVSIPGQVQAEQRSIYVGDLIELTVPTQALTKDEILERFREFEIVNVEEDHGSYSITLRSFEPGKKVVALGDKEIVIEIRSTLDEIDRDQIFEGNMTPLEAGFRLDWRYPFYGLLAIFVVSGILYFRKFDFRRKKASVSPYQQFVERMNGLPPDDEQYLVNLTFYFKEYIELAYSRTIRGKTAAEIMDEIGRISGLQEFEKELAVWLEDCNRLKFSGVAAFQENQSALHERLLSLVGRLDRRKVMDG